MARKQRRRRSQRHQAGAWLALRALLLRVGLRWVLLSLSLVCALNAAVGCAGDSKPHLLSPRHLPQKTAALAAWVWHQARHPFVDCRADRGLLRAAARRHQLPLSFLTAVAQTESDIRPHRISRAGAMGVMQLMPETAALLQVDDPFDGAQSIDGGARYLSQLWRRYRGDSARVAAAYNAGPGRVPRRGDLNIPPETRHYVARVLEARRKLSKR